jgi:hypothetical protein
MTQAATRLLHDDGVRVMGVDAWGRERAAPRRAWLRSCPEGVSYTL